MRGYILPISWPISCSIWSNLLYLTRYKRDHSYSKKACVTQNVHSRIKTNNLIGPTFYGRIKRSNLIGLIVQLLQIVQLGFEKNFHSGWQKCHSWNLLCKLYDYFWIEPVFYRLSTLCGGENYPRIQLSKNLPSGWNPLIAHTVASHNLFCSYFQIKSLRLSSRGSPTTEFIRRCSPLIQCIPVDMYPFRMCFSG